MPKFRSRLRVIMAEWAFERNTKLTQRELAKRINISKATVNNWLNDDLDRIEAVTMMKLCTFFEVSPAELIIVINDNGEVATLNDAPPSENP